MTFALTRRRLVTALLILTPFAHAALDLDQQTACRRRIAPHLRALKTARPVPNDASILAQRAAEVDAAFINPRSTRFFRNARGEHVLVVSARGRPARLRLVVDRGFIVLGSEITRHKLTLVHCADILP